MTAHLRRHPCEVTADRLLDHVNKYHPEPIELRDEIVRVREWLLTEAEGDAW